ncbi:hypothetical protein JQ596_15725 [Bradyrhizobium manausense]|uniref:hypothetical protein n=1 Tax=Bradyrhizobium TaxID=374 RepID=UPI001BACBCC4|nr:MULTISPECIES: hypothetical protein [Bradyrhizobium]MBR0826994.1 hypothetical protein [Bradyrhizobium manausense]UVO32277.1 hypothetical protein KUF59_17410 [Bradyrhizobium arachidis]
MHSLYRHSLALAAVMSVSVGIVTAQPASAADQANDRISAQEVAKETAKPAPVRHRVAHVGRRTVHRTAAIYRRAFAPVARDYTCSSIWCGRQYVLMLGIGY